MAQKKITDLQLRSEIEDDLNFPSDDGIQSYRVTAAQMWNFIQAKLLSSHNEINNLGLAISVASSALTVALKTKAGTDPTSTDRITVGFRSATLSSGTYVQRAITSALSLVVSSGSTLGQIAGQASRIWVYLIDNAGSPELAVSRSFFPENALVSTTAEGGAGAADNYNILYSTTARSNVAVRCIGYFVNTQVTAGTWAAAPTQIQLMPAQTQKMPTVTRITSTGSGTYYTPPGVLYIKVRCVGAGGGGAGGGTAGGGNSSAGGDTTFGASGTKGEGGQGCTWGGGAGGDTGSGVLGGYQGVTIPGSRGGNVAMVPGTTYGQAGGKGGDSHFGGGGGARVEQAGYAGQNNTGGGGGGGGYTPVSTGVAGGGGGGGGYVEVWINDPQASYGYVVGAGGAGGTAGTNGFAGGAGGSGTIVIEEYYS